MKKVMIVISLIMIIGAGVFIGLATTSTNLEAGARWSAVFEYVVMGNTYYMCTGSGSSCCQVWP